MPSGGRGKQGVNMVTQLPHRCNISRHPSHTTPESFVRDPAADMRQALHFGKVFHMCTTTISPPMQCRSSVNFFPTFPKIKSFFRIFIPLKKKLIIVWSKLHFVPSLLHADQNTFTG